MATDARLERAVARLENGGRILVTRLLYLGDVVLTLPLVDAIRDRFPEASVDYLCRRPAFDLVKRDPRFDQVFEVRSDGGVFSSLQLVRRLRARRYDAVIDLFSNPRSAWLSWFSGASVRIGGDRRGRRRLYTHPVKVDPGIRSAVAHHMEYARPLGVDVDAAPPLPVLSLEPGEIEMANDFLGALGVETRRPDRPRIGLHPGGKWDVKRWPVAAFAELASLLAEGWNATVVAFTGPGELHYTEELKSLAGDRVTVVPELPVRAAAAALSLLDGVVVSDGGIMHLSVSVGTPTVGIFGSAEPDVWFPYESSGPYAAAFVPMDCRPCHRHVCPLGHTDCLNSLAPNAVAEALRGVMSGGGIAPRGAQ
jgi:lipopolysaccharide heptosyltransferase II